MLQDYHLVKHRRNWSTIYRCNHYTHYMKLGPKEEIDKEVQLYQKLKACDIPLPTLLGFEAHDDDLGWMKEESLHWRLYADLFTESYETHGNISSELIEEFIAYQHRHLQWQAKTIWKIDIINNPFMSYSYLYEEWEINHDTISALMEKIDQDTRDLPHCWNHGDHNPYNIFSDGVIDLEDWFYGTMWYDTITALTQNYWFPRNNWEPGELTRQHEFTWEQIQYFLENISKNTLGIDFTSPSVFWALFILRGIFVTVKSDETPLLRAYRYNRLKAVIDKYIAGENMIAHFQETY